MKFPVVFPFSNFVIANDLAGTSRHLKTLGYVSSKCFHASSGFYFLVKNFSSIWVVSSTFPQMVQILSAEGCYSQQGRIIFWTGLNSK